VSLVAPFQKHCETKFFNAIQKIEVTHIIRFMKPKSQMMLINHSCCAPPFPTQMIWMDEFVEGFFGQAVKNRFSGSIFMLDLPLGCLAVTDVHLRQIEA
jgi:hypothetical protein